MSLGCCENSTSHRKGGPIRKAVWSVIEEGRLRKGGSSEQLAERDAL
jgi:hypothetical protein